jgi:mono/diheme cytochrome c family protein
MIGRKQFFFEKKNQKTFACLNASAREQKFFGSFFQKKRKTSFLILALAYAAMPRQAHADAATISTLQVTAVAGASVYRQVCQGCHMPGGRGAAGAGAFPALAGNSHLEEAGYPITMVLNGHGGMPWFNGVLNDTQIANVVNYVRTNFGNHYTDMAAPADVAALRGPVPTLER